MMIAAGTVRRSGDGSRDVAFGCIGAICFKRRHEAGLRPDETAVRGGLAYSALSKIEQGHSLPTLDSIARIAFACGYDGISAFLFGLQVKDVLGQRVYDLLINALPPVR